MIENNSVQIMMGDQGEADMPRKGSGSGNGGGDGSAPSSSHRRYGRPSADYYEVAEHGLKPPANDNGRQGSSLSPKTKNILKVLFPLALGLAFLAWY